MDETTVRWVAVPAYEGLYEISDQGQVRTVARPVHYPAPRIKASKLISQNTRNGYMRIHLTSEGVTKNYSVHRLVLAAFVALPLPKQEACHRNGIRTDNRLSNLYWGSRADNIADRYALHGKYFKEGTTFMKRGRRRKADREVG